MNQEILDWLASEYAGNSVHQYLMATVIFCAVWVALPVIKKLLIYEFQRFDRTIRGTDLGFFIHLFDRVHFTVFPVVAFYIATQSLDMHSKIERGLQTVTTIVVVLQIITLLSFCVDHFVAHLQIGRSRSDLAAQSARQNLTTIGKAIIWIGGGLFLLSNVGINVSTLITGLGIGGIAVALAAQAILGDTFSSFTISLDKPFEIGDFVVVDGLRGTVERIGLKTTRIRSISGELLIFANSDLTKSRIQNYQQIQSRRATLQLGVTYETPADTLETIPTLIKEIVTSMPKTRFDRAHFVAFGASSLNFEAVYYVDTAIYNEFMDTQQAINFKIRRTFAERDIGMAYPTNTVYVASLPENVGVK